MFDYGVFNLIIQHETIIFFKNSCQFFFENWKIFFSFFQKLILKKFLEKKIIKNFLNLFFKFLRWRKENWQSLLDDTEKISRKIFLSKNGHNFFIDFNKRKNYFESFQKSWVRIYTWNLWILSKQKIINALKIFEGETSSKRFSLLQRFLEILIFEKKEKI